MNRREFEAVLVSVVISAETRADRAFETCGPEDCVSDLAAAVAVGRLYLRTYPEHASRAKLLGALGLPADLLSPVLNARALDERIRADFTHQRTVLLDGWLLARAEAAVCGLIALG